MPLATHVYGTFSDSDTLHRVQVTRTPARTITPTSSLADCKNQKCAIVQDNLYLTLHKPSTKVLSRSKHGHFGTHRQTGNGCFCCWLFSRLSGATPTTRPRRRTPRATKKQAKRQSNSDSVVFSLAARCLVSRSILWLHFPRLSLSVCASLSKLPSPVTVNIGC